MTTKEIMFAGHNKAVDLVNSLVESIIPEVPKKTKSYCETCGQDLNLFADFNDLEEENIALRDKVRDLRHELDEALQSQDERGHD